MKNIDSRTLNRSLSASIKDGVMSQVMVTLTSGVFLAAFALKLGASNFTIGLMAAIPALAAYLMQIPAIFIIEKVLNRKKIIVLSLFASRGLWVVVAFIPFLSIKGLQLPAMIIIMIVQGIIGSLAGTSWTSWMRDLVPDKRMGAFFSKRMSTGLIVGTPLAFLTGVFIDRWTDWFQIDAVYAYSFLFLAGFVSGYIGIHFLGRVTEPQMKPSLKKKGLFSLILKPFKDTNFRNLITFLGSWTFAVSMAAPFFTVYMLKRLELSMTMIIICQIITQTMNIIFLKVWGRFSDRFSNKSVLRISGPIFIFSILAWIFTTMPDRHFLTLPLLIIIHMVMGVSLAGTGIAIGNISMKLAPKGQGTAYLAAASLVNSLAAGIAPILGGVFADFFSRRELLFTINWKYPQGMLTIPTIDVQQWDFFFLFSFIIGLYSLHRLSLVREEGEVDKKIVLKEFLAATRKITRNISTVEGIRTLGSYPLVFFVSTVSHAASTGRKVTQKSVKLIRDTVRMTGPSGKKLKKKK